MTFFSIVIQILLEEIANAMKQASQTHMNKILGYTEDSVVSTDFISSTYSSVFDKNAGIALSDKFYKIVSWYDNEMVYATRLIDLALYISSKE